MNRMFIRKHINSFAIIVFLFIFYAINFAKPSFMYSSDGSFRQFGVGYKKNTVVPVWFVAIIIGILSYLSILYFLTLPKL